LNNVTSPPTPLHMERGESPHCAKAPLSMWRGVGGEV